MYTFYTDKTELFECNIKLQGAKLKDSKTRLILESDDFNLMFHGSIDASGKCTIPIKKLKSLMTENTTGNVKLEVIAEDTYFEPWTDKFEVKTSKKVMVEVKSNTKENLITETKTKVQVTVNPNLSAITNEIVGACRKKKITVHNLKEHAEYLRIMGSYVNRKYKLSKTETATLIENVIKSI